MATLQEAPFWLLEARRHIGLREIKGGPTAPQIAAWLQKLGAWWRDDETPWCGVAMAGVMQAVGLPYPRAYYRAKAWAEWGIPLQSPCLGCVVVIERKGGGHVGLAVARDDAGRLILFGGNQGDAMQESSFDIIARPPIAYRWPSIGSPQMYGLPRRAASGASSINEA